MKESRRSYFTKYFHVFPSTQKDIKNLASLKELPNFENGQSLTEEQEMPVLLKKIL